MLVECRIFYEPKSRDAGAHRLLTRGAGINRWVIICATRCQLCLLSAEFSVSLSIEMQVFRSVIDERCRYSSVGYRMCYSLLALLVKCILLSLKPFFARLFAHSPFVDVAV